MRIPTTLLAWLAVSGLLHVPGTAQIAESAKFVVGDARFQDYFGRAVAVSDEWAVVGEPNDEIGIRPYGAAFFFRRVPAGWVLQQEVHASAAIVSQQFGNAVAVDGSTAVVGAHFESNDALWRGAAYVYELVDGEWVEVRRLLPHDHHRQTRFGGSVAVDGRWLAVHAPGDQSLYQWNGAAYLYERVPSGWQFREALVPSRPAGDPVAAMFSMTLRQGVLALSDIDDVVYVFEHVEGQWRQTVILKDPTPLSEDNFGSSLAYDAGFLVVGNRLNQFPVHNSGSGSALVYQRLGPGDWVFRQELRPSIQTFGVVGTDRFGASVAVRGDRILVGAPDGLDAELRQRGQAYLFERKSPAKWAEVAQLTSSRVLLPEGIGNSVSLSDSFALVGSDAGIGGTPGVRSGTAYVYELHLGEITCPAQANSSGAAAELAVTGSVEASVGVLELTARALPPREVGLFLASRTQGLVRNPRDSQGDLCLGAPVALVTVSLGTTGEEGVLHHALDTRHVPFDPPVPILAGESWSFQAWFRDHDPGPTSNFSEAVTVEFR